MQALSAVLHLNVKVAYLDGRGAGDEVDFVDFENGAGKDVNGIRDLVLLYRYVDGLIFLHMRDLDSSADQVITISLNAASQSMNEKACLPSRYMDDYYQ